MPSFLKFFVYENNEEFPVCDMSAPECGAIEECVKNIIPTSYSYISSGFLFDVETSIADEAVEEEGCGLLKCNIIVNGKERAAPMPYELLKFLAGKKFRVKPKQYGLNPWGKKVEILFEALPPRVVLPLTRPATAVADATPGAQVVTISIPVTSATITVSVSASV